MINWQPIDTMPEDRKDGRWLLLWEAFGDGGIPAVAKWDEADWSGTGPCWSGVAGGPSPAGYLPFEPTHWADINSPT